MGSGLDGVTLLNPEVWQRLIYSFTTLNVSLYAGVANVEGLRVKNTASGHFMGLLPA